MSPQDRVNSDVSLAWWDYPSERGAEKMTTLKERRERCRRSGEHKDPERGRNSMGHRGRVLFGREMEPWENYIVY